MKLIFFSVFIISNIITATTNSIIYEEYLEGDNIDTKGELMGQSKTLPRKITLSRGYGDERDSKRGYRYFGTGSRSGNSFAPTSVHKLSSSLDNNNYFVTTKGINKVKDMETADSSSSAGNPENNYLTVYESPTQTTGTGAGGSNYLNEMEEAFGEMALASEIGHGGWHLPGHGGKGCNAALGLLGVLGLAAYLQNVLGKMQPNNNRTMGRRRRRNKRHIPEFDELFDPESFKDQIEKLDLFLLPVNENSKDMKLDVETYNKVMQHVFPLLGAVAHAQDGLIPIHCTHRSVCAANKILVKFLGSQGHAAGIRMSSAIAKLLAKITMDERAEQIRMIIKAGKMGRNGRNCVKVFPTCNRLKSLPTYNIPILKHNEDEI